MKVDLLYFEGCPGHDALLPRVRELLAEQGLEQRIELRLVESLEDAHHERFLGSPTLRIDGEDVEPGAAAREDFGLKCRLYPGRGAAGRTPPDEWILAALKGGR